MSNSNAPLMIRHFFNSNLSTAVESVDTEGESCSDAFNSNCNYQIHYDRINKRFVKMTADFETERKQKINNCFTNNSNDSNDTNTNQFCQKVKEECDASEGCYDRTIEIVDSKKDNHITCQGVNAVGEEAYKDRHIYACNVSSTGEDKNFKSVDIINVDQVCNMESVENKAECYKDYENYFSKTNQFFLRNKKFSEVDDGTWNPNYRICPSTESGDYCQSVGFNHRNECVAKREILCSSKKFNFLQRIKGELNKVPLVEPIDYSDIIQSIGNIEIPDDSSSFAELYQDKINELKSNEEIKKKLNNKITVQHQSSTFIDLNPNNPFESTQNIDVPNIDLEGCQKRCAIQSDKIALIKGVIDMVKKDENMEICSDLLLKDEQPGSDVMKYCNKMINKEQLCQNPIKPIIIRNFCNKVEDKTCYSYQKDTPEYHKCIVRTFFTNPQYTELVETCNKCQK